jgi:hypothetical protein
LGLETQAVAVGVMLQNLGMFLDSGFVVKRPRQQACKAKEHGWMGA